MTAGAHMVSASFVREMWEPEGLPQPLQRGRVLTNDEIYMGHASVGALSISGPYRVERSTGHDVERSTRDTPSRRAIFICQPRRQSDERECASKILTRVARLAYRRPATAADTRTLVEFFGRGRRDGGSLTPVFSSRSSARWSIPISCCACIAIHGATRGSASASSTR
jgi:hypothetical protein